MALIHWWPLNGDTGDRIGNRPGTLLGTATLTEPGKLGTCLSAGDGTKITAGVSVENCNLLDEISDEYSAAMWIKVHGTHVHYEGAFISSGDWNNKRWTFGINQANNRIQPLTNASNQNYISLGKTLTNNQWYHVTTVYKDGKAYLYLDGKLINSVTATAPYQSSATNLCIGRETYAAGYFSFNGDICDVRIYDHALSIEEVRELSKGLMVHYTFNDRLAEKQTNLITGLGAGGQTTYDSAEKSITTKGVNADTYFYLKLSSAMIPGNTYTISCIGENIGYGKLFTFGMAGQTGAHTRFTIKDGYNSLTFTATSYVEGKTSVLMDDTARTGWESNAKFHSFQLVEGDHDIPLLSHTMEEYPDESGNGYNAAQVDITYTSDSNHGTRAVSFNGNTSYLEVPFIKSDLFTSDYTLSFWVKHNDDTRAVYLGDYGLTGGTLINFERKVGGAFRYWHGGSPDKTFSSVVAPAGEWVMITVTYTPGTMKAYLNGVLKETYSHTSTKIKTSGKLQIGRDSRTGTTALNGSISDFRFYGTALSENDVKNLYESRASVDKEQNVFSNEFIEFFSDNLVNVDSWEQGGITDANGTNADGMANRLRTKYIPVLGGLSYTYKAATGINVRGVHYYDADNKWISYSTSSGSQTTPENAAYVRWVIQYSDANTAIPLADIATYGAIMMPTLIYETIGITDSAETVINKNYTISTHEMCENHKAGIFKKGELTSQRFIED